jgi:hypothetical protein
LKHLKQLGAASIAVLLPLFISLAMAQKARIGLVVIVNQPLKRLATLI